MFLMFLFYAIKTFAYLIKVCADSLNPFSQTSSVLLYNFTCGLISSVRSPSSACSLLDMNQFSTRPYILANVAEAVQKCLSETALNVITSVHVKR